MTHDRLEHHAQHLHSSMLPPRSFVSSQIMNGRKLGEGKLVDIPGHHLNIPFLGTQDKECLAFCGKHSSEWHAAYPSSHRLL